MQKLIKYWNEFWFKRYDPVSTSIFRISLGLLISVMFICNYVNWERFYDADGMISLHETVPILNNVPEDACSIFHFTEGKVPMKVYWWISMIAALFFTMGFQTRLATIALYIIQSSMIHRNYMIVNGDDLVIRMVLFYSCFFPLGHCLSIDNWIKKKWFKNSPATEFPHIWPIRLMQINVALIYAISLPYKLIGDVAWINGQAIYYTATSNMWGRFPFPEAFCMCDCLLSKIMTYGTVLIEGAFPLLVWFKETNLIVTVLAASLHLGIAVFVPNVLFFTLAMVCSFWVFVQPETTHWLLNKLKLILKKLIPNF